MKSNKLTGNVVEIFSSIQGEGLFCGQRQTFIRMHGCNLACSFCDTPSALQNHPCIEMTTLQLAHECACLGVYDVSLTGGEPLLQADFLSELIVTMMNSSDKGKVPQKPFRFHLETNGTLPKPMKQIDHLVDVVAMDIKLPSATGLDPLWKQHAEFLEACSVDKVFVKVVVAAESTQDEIITASKLVAGISPNIPMILQPVSGSNQPCGDVLISHQNTASDFLRDVRVIPQCHKILGVR